MAGQHKEASVAPHGVELTLPHREYLPRVFYDASYVRFGQIGVLLPIVETPVRRQLDDLALPGFEHVRAVVVHKSRVVEQAILGYQSWGSPACVPERRAVTERLHPLMVEDRERPLEVGPLLGLRQPGRLAVAVGMVTHVVPGLDDPLYQTGV